jgi:uncharacterized membrane protein
MTTFLLYLFSGIVILYFVSYLFKILGLLGKGASHLLTTPEEIEQKRKRRKRRKQRRINRRKAK